MHSRATTEYLLQHTDFYPPLNYINKPKANHRKNFPVLYINFHKLQELH